LVRRDACVAYSHIDRSRACTAKSDVPVTSVTTSQRESGYERIERDCYETQEWVMPALLPHLGKIKCAAAGISARQRFFWLAKQRLNRICSIEEVMNAVEDRR
jgi:hypothetical protein